MNLKLFCITLNPVNLKTINNLNLIPVGLGDKNFSKEWLQDKEGKSIASKNNFYGEYTFHYWIWKNYLNHLGDSWIGFCQYRKFWSYNEKKNNNINDLASLKKEIIGNHLPSRFDSYESILGEPIYTNHFRFSKFIKHNLKNMIQSPSLFFDKNKRNIRFHFDMMHGKDNLDRAISLLDSNEKQDFKLFVLNTSFNPHNMFICKSKDILLKYYESLFPWLERCEQIFGFQNLTGYGQKRIYGFLAERYLSYWFQKYTKFKTTPIIFNDINNYKL